MIGYYRLNSDKCGLHTKDEGKAMRFNSTPRVFTKKVIRDPKGKVVKYVVDKKATQISFDSFVKGETLVPETSSLEPESSPSSPESSPSSPESSNGPLESKDFVPIGDCPHGKHISSAIMEINSKGQVKPDKSCNGRICDPEDPYRQYWCPSCVRGAAKRLVGAQQRLDSYDTENPKALDSGDPERATLQATVDLFTTASRQTHGYMGKNPEFSEFHKKRAVKNAQEQLTKYRTLASGVGKRAKDAALKVINILLENPGLA